MRRLAVTIPDLIAKAGLVHRAPRGTVPWKIAPELASSDIPRLPAQQPSREGKDTARELARQRRVAQRAPAGAGPSPRGDAGRWQLGLRCSLASA